MKARQFVIPAALAAAVAFGAPPAYAQHHGRGGEQAQARGGGGQRGGGQQAQARGGEQRSAPQRQAESQRGGEQRPATVDRTHPAQNAPAARPAERGAYAVPRAQVAPRYENRGYDNRGYNNNRGYDNRGYGNRGYYVPRGYYNGGHYYGPRGYYYGHPRVIVPIVPYYRPYYSFRPWFSLGFGISIGYPVPYPYAYGYPAYVYGYPYPDTGYPPAGYPPDPYGYGNQYPQYPQSAPGYPPQQGPYGSVQAQPPAQGTYGGVSFEITPDDAAIYVDGAYVGVARDFGPDHQPLTMTPGNHRIELQANGCQPLSFDVNVQAGQVIPYRGALQPL